jgi:hypothetical protein
MNCHYSLSKQRRYAVIGETAVKVQLLSDRNVVLGAKSQESKRNYSDNSELT